MDYYCQNNICKEFATYGYNKGENIFCKTHMLNDMILTFEQEQILELGEYEAKKNRKCYYISCNVSANFNFPEIKKAICCKSHILNGMIDVKNITCAFEDCEKRPTFNFPGKKALMCSTHKLENMVDVKHQNCEYENCNARPRFNFTGLKKATFCVIHKKNDMIDVTCKKCTFQNCKKQPKFNFEGLSPIYCSEHKKNDMIDVKSKNCAFQNCKKQPSYNFEGKKAILCVSHKENGMVNVKHVKCEYKDCNIIACYNFEELSPIRCLKHKDPDMINVTNKTTCINEWCSKRVQNKYDGYCMRCYIHKFPDQQISKNFKVKERYMTDYLKEEFSTYQITFDKTAGGCSQRRPDVYIDLLTHVIIIECDENQHKNYDTTCEIARVNELFTDFADRSIVFIRFNPDAYTIDNKKIPSSFKYLKKFGVPSINNKEEWNTRLQKLKECIEKYITNIPTEKTTFEYLFYDS